MWCNQCQQQVLTLPISGERFACSHCGMSASPANNADGEAIATALSKKTVASQPPSGSDLDVESDTLFCQTADDWVFDDQLQDAARLIQSVSKQLGTKGPLVASRSVSSRLEDPMGETILKWQAHLSSPVSLPHFKHSSHSYQRLIRTESSVSRSLLSVSLIASIGGAAGLGWSFFSPHADPWGDGLPTTVGCLLAMFLGLICHIHGLLNSNRVTAQSLADLDEQFQNLRETATSPADDRAMPAAHTFEQHYSVSSSELLLADMKRQLDLLTRQLSQTHR